MAQGRGLIACPGWFVARLASSELHERRERVSVARGKRALNPRPAVHAFDDTKRGLVGGEVDVFARIEAHRLAVADDVVVEVDEVDVAERAERWHLLGDDHRAAEQADVRAVADI